MTKHISANNEPSQPSPRRERALPKTPTCISGLDGVLHGGLPAKRTTLVSGGPGTGKSIMGKENLKRLCETYLKDGCQSEIVDVLEDFQSALENNVLITPTLILVSPPPKVTIFGNLSDTRKVLAALRLRGGE